MTALKEHSALSICRTAQHRVPITNASAAAKVRGHRSVPPRQPIDRDVQRDHGGDDHSRPKEGAPHFGGIAGFHSTRPALVLD